jgi:hypothetical protein
MHTLLSFIVFFTGSTVLAVSSRWFLTTSGSGKWVRLPLELQESDSAKSFRDLSAAVSRRFSEFSRADGKFSLHLHPRELQEAIDGAPLDHVTKDEWPVLLEQCRSGGIIVLLACAATPASPASWVDPFWACERTDLPQTRGIAAAWYWPKALQGNAHPGALLPFGGVSTIPFSGAYPSGYGLNGSASGGIPELLRSRNGPANAPAERQEQRDAMPPQQYTTVGFTHFQASGTGSIGNYMNCTFTCGVEPLAHCALVAVRASSCTIDTVLACWPDTVWCAGGRYEDNAAADVWR